MSTTDSRMKQLMMVWRWYKAVHDGMKMISCWKWQRAQVHGKVLGIADFFLSFFFFLAFVGAFFPEGSEFPT